MSVQKRLSRVFVWVMAAGGCALVAAAVQDGPSVPAVGPERAKLFSVPQLADLDIFVGAWKVAETYFDEKGVQRAAVNADGIQYFDAQGGWALSRVRRRPGGAT